MKISELEAFLAQVKQTHGDVDLVYTRCSDYGWFTAEDVDIRQVVVSVSTGAIKSNPFVQRWHDAMVNDPTLERRFVVHFAGN